jgi:apolipoprotein N-acyltransferase
MNLLPATLDDDGPRARLILRFGRIGLALAAGAAAALAHPPFGILPGLLGYALLMFLTERATSVRGGFWMGWLAGFA